MAAQPPSTSTQPRKPLLTLRTIVILTISTLITIGVGDLAWQVAHLDPVAIIMTMGTAFTGTVTFLNKILDQ